jgi:hypothetical protein
MVGVALGACGIGAFAVFQVCSSSAETSAKDVERKLERAIPHGTHLDAVVAYLEENRIPHEAPAAASAYPQLFDTDIPDDALVLRAEMRRTGSAGPLMTKNIEIFVVLDASMAVEDLIVREFTIPY